MALLPGEFERRMRPLIALQASVTALFAGVARSPCGPCAGVVIAAALLAASAVWPVLFVLHLLLQSVVGPFWAASEHVLNQRAMDLHGSVGDRIIAREGTLGVFRLVTLGAFWWGTQTLDDRWRLITGAGLMALAAVLELSLGRAWLSAGRRRHQAQAT